MQGFFSDVPQRFFTYTATIPAQNRVREHAFILSQRTAIGYSCGRASEHMLLITLRTRQSETGNHFKTLKTHFSGLSEAPGHVMIRQGYIQVIPVGMIILCLRAILEYE